MNGVVDDVSASGFSIRVQQSFGNCPKYIVPREASFSPRAPGEVVRSSTLDEVAVRMLRSADTFFNASAYPAGEDEVVGIESLTSGSIAVGDGLFAGKKKIEPVRVMSLQIGETSHESIQLTEGLQFGVKFDRPIPENSGLYRLV